MREALASVLAGLSSLQEDDYRERPVDRLHALGAAQAISVARGKSLLVPLGRELMAYLDGDCKRSKIRARADLARALEWREHRLNLTRESALLVASQAIDEAKSGTCRVCNGKTDSNGIYSIPDVDKMGGWKTGDGPVPMRPCPACGGSGRHRFSDAERERHLGALHKNTSAAFGVAHALISGAIIEAVTTSRKLFRD